MLQDAEAAIREVAEHTGPAVVGIGSRGAVGSGVVVEPGRVITNAHNVHGGTTTVTMADGTTVTGEVVAADLDGDLAVVAADTGSVEPPGWADDVNPSLGTALVALSNPGGRGLRVTLGFVSGVDRSFRGPRGRRISGAIEHTAPLLPGSSGGPLVDLGGRLVGLNTHRLGEGFYLAMAGGDDLRRRIDALAGGEAPTTTRLGVAVIPAFIARRMRKAVGLPDVEGVLIRSVDEGSPAARAGLVQGDLITAVGRHPVSEIDDLHSALDEAGAEATVSVVRGTEEVELTVTFG